MAWQVENIALALNAFTNRGLKLINEATISDAFAIDPAGLFCVQQRFLAA